MDGKCQKFACVFGKGTERDSSILMMLIGGGAEQSTHHGGSASLKTCIRERECATCIVELY